MCFALFDRTHRMVCRPQMKRLSICYDWPHPIFLILAELEWCFSCQPALTGWRHKLRQSFCGLFHTNGITMSILLLVLYSGFCCKHFRHLCHHLRGNEPIWLHTKRDLSSIGRILFFGLIGLIIATLVNMFLHSGIVETIANYAGVIIFIGLTATTLRR